MLCMLQTYIVGTITSKNWQDLIHLHETRLMYYHLTNLFGIITNEHIGS